MDKNPLISICIPTNGRAEIVKETLESIVSQGVNEQLYEVCISDGSPTNETKNVVEKYFKCYGNIRYVKSNCKTPFNLVEALKLGDGKYLKLHNDYSKFKHGELINFIKTIEKYQNSDAFLFFSFGALKNKNKIIEFKSFDSFMQNIGYYSTWSSAFCIRKKDFDNLINSKINIEMMFPHLSLLYACTDKCLYIVDNHTYVSNIPLKKKGGYNLPKTFIHIYLSMTRQLLLDKKISQNTFEKIKAGILKFVAIWYATIKTDKRYFFTFENLKQYLGEYYTNKEVKKFYVFHYFYLIKFKIKNTIKYLINK